MSWSEPAPVLRSSVSISTNRDAREVAGARRAAAGPCWFVADLQTGGEGRRGRAWQHLPGNLAATLLLPVAMEDFRTPAAFSFLAGLAAIEPLTTAGVPEVGVSLKWPNDLTVLGRKLGGILVERVNLLDGPGVIIGMGINLAATPDLGGIAVTSVREAFGSAPSPLTFLAGIDAAMRGRWAQFRAEGFAPVREAYLARVTGLGRPITVTLAQRREEGVFEGIDADGALLLRRDNDITRMLAGEIFLADAS